MSAVTTSWQTQPNSDPSRGTGMPCSTTFATSSGTSPPSANLHGARGAPWAERVVSPASTADAHEHEELDLLTVAQHKNHRVHGRDMVDATHGQWILVEQITARQVGAAGRH